MELPQRMGLAGRGERRAPRPAAAAQAALSWSHRMAMTAAAESARLSMLRDRVAALADAPAPSWELGAPAARHREVGRELV